MTEPIRVLHLSDLHFDGDTQWDADPVRNGLATDISSLVQNGLAPDFVAVTGDIANRGQSEDYIRAEAWFRKKLFPVLGTFDVKNLLLVPGNHDVDRNAVNLVAQSVESRLLNSSDQKLVADILGDPDQRRTVLRRHDAYLDFVQRLRNHTKRPEVPWWSNVRAIRGLKIHVAGLCSSWMSPHLDDDKGRLLIGRWQLNTSFQDSQAADINIALVHHPWSYLADFDARDIESGIARNYQLVLRGHLHIGRLYGIQTPDNTRLELEAGACYASSSYPNAYQLIEYFHDTGEVRVFYRLWRDGEWIPDRNAYRAQSDKGTISYYLSPRSIGEAYVDIQEESKKGHRIYSLRLNRPRKRNPLSTSVLFELKRAIIQAPSNATILVAGDTGVFSAGLDLDEMKKSLSAKKHLTLLMELFAAMNHRRPIATLVNGPAVAGGAGIALFADIVVAHSSANFTLPGSKHYRMLARTLIPIILRRRSVQSALFDEFMDESKDNQDLDDIEFDAEEAQSVGLVDLVSTAATLDNMEDEALGLLDERFFLKDAWDLYWEALSDQAVKEFAEHLQGVNLRNDFDALIAAVNAAAAGPRPVGLPGIENALIKKAMNAKTSFENGMPSDAITELNDFMTLVGNHAGKKIDAGDAATLIARAEAIRDAISAGTAVC